MPPDREQTTRFEKFFPTQSQVTAQKHNKMHVTLMLTERA